MFKKAIIEDKAIIDFWNSLSAKSGEIMIRNHLFQFEKNTNEIVFFIKNEGVFSNPETDFIQARFMEKGDKKSIIVEAKPFIVRLYLGLLLFIILFVLLQIQSNMLIGFTILTFAAFILFYNNNRINKGINKFKTILEVK